MPRRDYFINLDAERPTQALVTSFLEDTQASAPAFYRDETYVTRFHFLRANPNTSSSRPFVYVPTSGITTLKVAAGVVDAAPDGGTFTLTGGAGGTTSALAYNASAATVQTAVRAGMTGFSAATVTGNDGGPYTIDYGATGAQTDITGTATSLTPDGCTAVIVNTQNGSATLNEKWQVKLVKAYPLLRSSGWTTPNAVSVAATVVQSGSATASKVYSLTWNSDAYDGNVWVSVTAKTGGAETVGPIPYNASPEEMVALFAQHSVLVSTDISVTKSGAGSYEISFIGTQTLSNTPVIATSSNNLKIPDYFQGTLSAATAGVDDVLAGATSATVTFEVELEEGASMPSVACHRADAEFKADLIRNTPGQSTGIENYPSDTEVVNFNTLITGYTGGGTTNLDGLATTSKTAGYYLTFVHSTAGAVEYQLVAGTDAESSPDVIRPDDYNASTNAKVWKLKEIGGDVAGPAGTVTDNSIVRWDGTTGRLVKGSSVTIDVLGNLTVLGAELRTSGDIAAIRTSGSAAEIYTGGESAAMYTLGANAYIATLGQTANIYTAGADAYIAATGVNGYVQSRTTFKLTNGTYTTTIAHAPTAHYTLTLVPTGDVTMTLPSTSFAAARTDAAQTFTGVQTFNNSIELGHASDTTIARSAAGKVTIEGDRVVTWKDAVDNNVRAWYLTQSGVTPGCAVVDSGTVAAAVQIYNYSGNTYPLPALSCAGGSRSIVDFDHRHRVALDFYLENCTGAGVGWLICGETFNDSTVADPVKKGFGVKFSTSGVQLWVHDGVTLTLGAATAWTPSATIGRITFEYFGGTLTGTLDGTALGSATGGPSGDSAANDTGISLQALTGGTNERCRWGALFPKSLTTPN